MIKPNPALILDRDGVINVDRGTYTYLKEDWRWMPGILELAAAAYQKGYKLAVVTNQAGIARGRYGHEQVAALHRFMEDELAQAGAPIEVILYCPHYPEVNGRCLCRKPGHLMVERALALLQAAPEKSYMLGDRERDILAGMHAGCRTVLIGQNESLLADHQLQTPDALIPFL